MQASFRDTQWPLNCWQSKLWEQSWFKTTTMWWKQGTRWQLGLGRQQLIKPCHASMRTRARIPRTSKSRAQGPQRLTVILNWEVETKRVHRLASRPAKLNRWVWGSVRNPVLKLRWRMIEEDRYLWDTHMPSHTHTGTHRGQLTGLMWLLYISSFFTGSFQPVLDV